MILSLLLFAMSATAQMKEHSLLEKAQPYQFDEVESAVIINALEGVDFPKNQDGDFQVDLVSCSEDASELRINSTRVRMPFMKKTTCDLGLKEGFSRSLHRAKKVTAAFRSAGVPSSSYGDGRSWSLRDLQCDMKLKSCRVTDL